jgi:hypothetical protein
MPSLTAPVQNAFAHYLAKGIGRNVAAGIAGVLNYESGLNPLAENNSGTDTGGVLNPKGAIGVAQWNGLRQGNGTTGLADYAKDKGENWQDIATQLDFVLTECANVYPKVWAAIQANIDITDFVSLFVSEYESPKDPAPEIAAGLATAQALLALPVAPISTVPSASPVPAPPAIPTQPPSSAPVLSAADPELAAIAQICATLTPFSGSAVKRMVDYIADRLG